MLRWVLLAQETARETPGPELPEAVERLSGWDWITAGIILAASIALSQVLRKGIVSMMRRGGSDRPAARVVGRVAAYITVLAGLVYALWSLAVPITPLVGALGVGGIALAFALQETMENFIAGIFLEARRPFRRGDQISTNDLEGTVEDINLRTVVLRTFGGVRVVLPNAMVLKEPLVNFTAHPRRRTTFTVGVAYMTDLDFAREVILEAVGGVDGVLASPPAEALVEEFSDSSIDFAVRYWHEPSNATFWRVRDGVARAVKAAFNREGITIPFPQRTVWFPEGIETRAEDGVRRASDGRPSLDPSAEA